MKIQNNITEKADHGNLGDFFSTIFCFLDYNLKVYHFLFVGEQTKGSYLDADELNRLNGIDGLNGLVHLCSNQLL
jgi:hypothetical protein